MPVGDEKHFNRGGSIDLDLLEVFKGSRLAGPRIQAAIKNDPFAVSEMNDNRFSTAITENGYFGD